MYLDTSYDMGSMSHNDAGPSHMFAHGDTSRSPSMVRDDTYPPTSSTTSLLPTTRTSPPPTTGTAPTDVRGRDEMRFMPTLGQPTPSLVPTKFVHTKQGKTSQGTSEEKKTEMIFDGQLAWVEPERLQEIAGDLNSALTTTSIVPIQNINSGQRNFRELTLKQSVTLPKSLRSYWREDVLVLFYADRFLKLSLQLLSRYSNWLSSRLAARKKGNTVSSSGCEWAVSAVPEDFIYCGVAGQMSLLMGVISDKYLLLSMCRRNDMLSKKGVQPPSYWKTGTTIVGLVFQDGVILGADTRAIKGPIVCDKNCEKIHYVAPNIYCCGAGTTVDTEAVTVKWHKILTAEYGFGYQGHVLAALVLGGFDVTGPHLHPIYPHGSTDTLPFATMGSGSLAAMAMFSPIIFSLDLFSWPHMLQRDEGIKLVVEAIFTGLLFLASFHRIIVVGKVILNLILIQVSSPLELLPQGHKEYLRNHLLPNPQLEDLFQVQPFDMLDAALSNTVAKFPVDIQVYMLATNVIGFAYTLLQIAFSIFHIIMGNHLINGDGGALLDFYGDKVISYLLATGAAAGFGVTVDLKATFDGFGLVIDKSFYEKAYASASLLLLAFVCTAILSVISSYAVPKKV
ncbi:hypothetical protein SO802_016858 [Lithocarpus litseifolius]|uniref:Uncharacterized protein n=1 Tax=Lithocarpus litseifolius TaxID=425828 RepID=A0AAW2CZS6_9ROSI